MYCNTHATGSTIGRPLQSAALFVACTRRRECVLTSKCPQAVKGRRLATATKCRARRYIPGRFPLRFAALPTTASSLREPPILGARAGEKCFHVRRPTCQLQGARKVPVLAEMREILHLHRALVEEQKTLQRFSLFRDV